MPDAYLAEDENAVLRRSAPAPCVDCAHYQAKHSRAVDQVLIRCGAVQDGPNAHLLSSVLLRLARLEGLCEQHRLELGAPWS